MLPKRYQLLHLLADGRFHSGEELGFELGLGRAAVWKHIKSLQELDLAIFAVPGKGYRLSEPLHLLEREHILDAVPAPERALLGGLDIHTSIGSTNRSLMERAALGLPNGFACLAEHQSDGRGRQGRTWVSPFAANLYLSLLWRFDVMPARLSALSLVAGVAALEALQDCDVQDLLLKWPNDVIWQDRKLAGILLEMNGEATGPCQVVLGLGINVNMPPGPASAIDQPWVDVRTAGGRPIDRNRLAGRVLFRLLSAIRGFASDGPASCLERWRAHDYVKDQPVTLHGLADSVHGTAVGLDDDGALLVEVDGTLRRYRSGEVSLRRRDA